MNPASSWTTIFLKNVFTSILCGIANKFIQVVSATKQRDTINEVFLYGAGEESEKKQLGLKNLFCIYYVLIHANQTIDVCMPSVDSDTIAKCLINVHQKNKTTVRIVMHRNHEFPNFKPFLDSGIEIKVINKGEVPLEHEFILIDAADGCAGALAIIGSLDYETKHVNCNCDSTLMTSEEVVIFTLKREFDRIWNSTACTV